jgi:hypothetical protein
MNDINRRRETRRKMMAFTPVYDLHPRMLLGYLGDLTMRGALVTGTSITTINKKITMEIDFPSDIPGIPVLKVELPARIAWCRQDESPQYYNIGVEFLEVSPEHAALFQQILERYHFRYILTDEDFDQQSAV